MQNDATHAQIMAANPESSTWLSANAGSGKTSVLTNRVARLLLKKVSPQNILCLTYTKAAASEMQNRLFKRLGFWAMAPDDVLKEDLKNLGETADEGTEFSSKHLNLARQLFARAIETPGGLRIQTIHSFCAALLRRYPLEAGVNPGFNEMDERTGQQLRNNAVQEMAGSIDPDTFAKLAAQYKSGDIIALIGEILAHSETFRKYPPTQSEILIQLSQPTTLSENSILQSVFTGAEEYLLNQLIPTLHAGSSTDVKAGNKLATLLPFRADLSSLEVMQNVFLYTSKSQNPFCAKIGSFPTKGTQKTLEPLMPALNDLMKRVEQAREQSISLVIARQNIILYQFAHSFLSIYDSYKADKGLLDFDDLIQKSKALLNNPSLASWVLFRLDGGIDHILIDEAQDTSPQQWQVIQRLSEDFTSGASARDTKRTLFVVGDKKQSIYSFQGANLQTFDANRHDFKSRFQAIGSSMQMRQLDFSFRSSRAILDVVDATLAGLPPAALGSDIHHNAFFETLPGRVDLWPLIPKTEQPQNKNAWEPVDLISEDHHQVLLAQKIALNIKDTIQSGTQIIDKGETRPIHAGDFLILVRRRDQLFSQIIRACKQEGLPIAGADRLKLGEELVIKDLKTLLSFLVTPEDDLSLATALRSPLFGWSEEQLYRLAYKRKGSLWDALRHSPATPKQTLEILHDLRDQLDYLRPYEMLERILTRHHGRYRLLTRLGAEAEDAIDEFLYQSILYEQIDVPSLSGFLSWLENDDIEVKRAINSQSRNIKIMTAHGAKGLEANIVILPDTADRRLPKQGKLIAINDDFITWKGDHSDNTHPHITTAHETQSAKQYEESFRLLYVAMTRARSWLIVAGAGDAKLDKASAGKRIEKTREEWCWYRQIEAGLMQLGAQPLSKGAPNGTLRYSYGIWPQAGTPVTDTANIALHTLPEWLTQAAPTPSSTPKTLSPSNLGGLKVIIPTTGDIPPAFDDYNDEQAQYAKQRGELLHRLFEHLPKFPKEQWNDVAKAMAPPDFNYIDTLKEARKVLITPELSFIFESNSLSEVAFHTIWRGEKMHGIIDRLIISNSTVLAIDFKSNYNVPDTPEQVPEGLLRQMGAYQYALSQIYPNKKVDLALLWTIEPRLMPLGSNIVKTALDRVPPLDDSIYHT